MKENTLGTSVSMVQDNSIEKPFQICDIPTLNFVGNEDELALICKIFTERLKLYNH